MITAHVEVDCKEVAAHYDDLDRFYREIWGEHVHHGLWASPQATPEEATRRLIAVVAEQAGLKAGDAVCDVGCGYGGTARVLAGEYGARVTALTVSQAQHCARRGPRPDRRQPDVSPARLAGERSDVGVVRCGDRDREF